ncbi:MAG: 50S ribosomal protein L25 [Candidatus Paceibacterota bacterium]
MTISLEVTKREGKATAEQIPAVVYGPKQEAVALALDKRTFEKTLSEAGESTIINLEGLGEVVEVLVHDVAFDPVKGGVQHVDFYAIERGKELTTHVSLEFIGEAPAEKSGGVLTKALHEVEVTCRPSALPKHIEVDLSVLTEIDSAIRISDLSVPEGVTIGNDAEETVAVMSEAKEESEEPVEAVDMDAIEVEGKKPESAEGGESKEEAPAE